METPVRGRGICSVVSSGACRVNTIAFGTCVHISPTLSALTFHSHRPTFPRPSSVEGAPFQAVKKCANSYIRRKPIDVPSSSSHICGSKVDFEQLYRLSSISVRIEPHRPLAIQASLDYIPRCKFGHAAHTRSRCWSRS